MILFKMIDFNFYLGKTFEDLKSTMNSSIYLQNLEKASNDIDHYSSVYDCPYIDGKNHIRYLNVVLRVIVLELHNITAILSI